MAKEYIAAKGNLKKAVTRAAAVLRRGGVVVFPTETVYGIGVLATDAVAVRQLRELKQRPAPRPFQFLVPDTDAAKELGAQFSPRAEQLARTFWPGPLTLVVPDGTKDFKTKNDGADSVGTDSEGTIGVRVPDFPFVLALCRELGGAIMSSSANPAGAPAPKDAAAADAFGDEVDLLVDGGPTEGAASTVAKCIGDQCEILRSGGVSDAAIQECFS